MLYAVICTDKPGSLPLRQEKRPEHLEHLKSLGDQLVLAGPFTEDDGVTMNGSLVVIEADTPEAARALAEKDPFFVHGVFESVEIRPWKWSVKNPNG